jgi:hypothetical protein
MTRFSVRSVMLSIIAAAVSLAALRNANALWGAALPSVLVLAVTTSVIGAIGLRGREQYGWAGFLLFSVVYLVVTIGNILPERFEDPFRTSWLLDYVTAAMSMSSSSDEQWLVDEETSMQLFRTSPHPELTAEELDAVESEHKLRLAMWNFRTRWRSWLPGAENQRDFLRVGQSLFALLSGIIGTIVGRIFYARRNRSEAEAP